MSKIKPKAILITTGAFLFAIVAIYVDCYMPPKKADSATINSAIHEDMKQAQDEAVEEEAKREFLRDEMMRDEDEDEEDEEEEKLIRDDEQKLSHDDQAHEEVHEEKEAREEDDDIDELIHSDEKPEHNHSPIAEDEKKAEDSQAPRQGEKVISRGEAEENKQSLDDKIDSPQETDIAPRSVFSATAHILPVVISNGTELQIETEADPYEEVVTPNIEASGSSEEHSNAQPNTVFEFNKADGAAQAEERTKRSKAYLNATSSLSRLMIKFLQKVDYTKELANIDQTKLPYEVTDVLSEMRDFAENDIKTPMDSNAKIFPKEGVLDRIAGHFVQIEKVSDSKNKDEKYEKICKKLYILEDYFYSQKFLNEMMGHD